MRTRWLAAVAGSVTVIAAAVERHWIDVAFWSLFLVFFVSVPPASGTPKHGARGRLLAWILVVALIALASARIVMLLRPAAT